MPERPPSDLKRVTAQYHAAVQSLTDNALADLQGRWQGVQATLDLKIRRLTDAIAAAEAKGETVNVAWLTQARRLEELRAAVQGDVSAFADGAADIVQQAITGAADLGQAAAQAALAATVPPGVNFTFGVPPADVAEELAGALQPGSPLASLFSQLGPQVAAWAQQALFTGVALGENPRTIAQRLGWATNMAAQRAEVIARTETLRAWRHAQFANYQANRDVVQQWMWAADFGPRCCGACIAMDGTYHDVDTELDDHICGRCSAIPITRPWADILADGGMSQAEIEALGLTETSGMAWAQSRESGESWLARQSVEIQNQILGPAKAEAWRQGAFPLERVVGVVHDPQWGSSIRELSLAQMGIDAQTWLQAARAAGNGSVLADEAALQAAHAETSVTVAAEQRAEQVAQAKAAADEWYAQIARSIAEGRAGGLTAEEAKAAADEWFAQVSRNMPPGGLSTTDIAREMERRFGLVANPAEIPAAIEAASAADNIVIQDAQAFARASQSLFDRQLTAEDIRGLVGAPDEARITVATQDDGGLVLQMEGPRLPNGEEAYYAMRFVNRDANGLLYVDNVRLNVAEELRGQGLGTRLFADQTHYLSEQGVRYITTEAEGAPGAAENGYYTWAREGYTGALPDASLSALRDAVAAGDVPATWGDYTRVEQLMATPEGQAWWKANGSAFSGVFDLTPGSYSMRTLDNYLAEKGMAAAAAETAATEAEEANAAIREASFSTEPLAADALEREQERIFDAIHPASEASTRTAAASDAKARVTKALADALADRPDFKTVAQTFYDQEKAYLESLSFMTPERIAERLAAFDVSPEATASRLLQTWAGGEMHGAYMPLQQAIRDEFGLTGLARMPRTKANLADLAAWKEAQPGLRAFAREMYNQTQDFLRANGITEVPLYRAAAWEAGKLPKAMDLSLFDGEAHATQMALRAASSFTVDPELAAQFASMPPFQEGDLPSYSLVMAGRVPAELILSTPQTGIGALDEYEMVVLGGRYTAIVIGVDNSVVSESSNIDEILANYHELTYEQIADLLATSTSTSKEPQP